MNKLEFFQERNIGDRISLVCRFIRQNGMLFMKAGMYLLLLGIVCKLIINSVGFNFINALEEDGIDISIIICSLLYTLWINTYAMEYTLSDEPSTITFNGVLLKALKNFFPILSGIVLIVLFIFFCAAMILGTKGLSSQFETSHLALIAACIWFLITVSLFIPAYLYSRKGVLKALNESYRLIQRNWFSSFCFIFISWIFLLGLGIFGNSTETTTHKDISAILIYIILFAASLLGTLIATLFTHILYTHLKAKKDGIKSQLTDY